MDSPRPHQRPQTSMTATPAMHATSSTCARCVRRMVPATVSTLVRVAVMTVTRTKVWALGRRDLLSSVPKCTACRSRRLSSPPPPPTTSSSTLGNKPSTLARWLPAGLPHWWHGRWPIHHPQLPTLPGWHGMRRQRSACSYSASFAGEGIGFPSNHLVVRICIFITLVTADYMVLLFGCKFYVERV